MEKSKAFTFIGFAIRARKVKMGVNAVKTLKKAVLLILCHTASENTLKEAVSLSNKLNAKLLILNEIELEEMKTELLIELEKITGFSCSWEPYVNEEATTNTHTEYDIYWNFNWTTDDNNINPDGAILLTSEWTGVDKNREG